MSTALLPMSDKNKKPVKGLISVKIEADVYRLIKTVAAWRGQNISDYLTESMRPIAERDFSQMNKSGR